MSKIFTVCFQDAPFFKENEKEQLCRRYGLSNEELKQALDGSAYVFEQAAFSSIAPEPLIQALEEAGYHEAQAKVGRFLTHSFPIYYMYLST